MKLPTCEKCKSNYNKKNRQPRVLPKCGHTYCLSCIQSLISAQTPFDCVIDGTTYSNLTNVDIFPSNVHIQHMIIDSPKVCQIHNKALEFFCLSDNMEICSACGLLGAHKTHKITTLTDLENNSKELLVGIKKQI